MLEVQVNPPPTVPKPESRPYINGGYCIGDFIAVLFSFELHIQPNAVLGEVMTNAGRISETRVYFEFGG